MQYVSSNPSGRKLYVEYTTPIQMFYVDLRKRFNVELRERFNVNLRKRFNVDLRRKRFVVLRVPKVLRSLYKFD